MLFIWAARELDRESITNDLLCSFHLCFNTEPKQGFEEEFGADASEDVKPRSKVRMLSSFLYQIYTFYIQDRFCIPYIYRGLDSPLYGSFALYKRYDKR
jgi:hypothetical protein